jgi:hypothetical protein
MHPIVETKRDQVIEVRDRFPVRRPELFGSAASGDFDAA